MSNLKVNGGNGLVVRKRAHRHGLTKCRRCVIPTTRGITRGAIVKAVSRDHAGAGPSVGVYRKGNKSIGSLLRFFSVVRTKLKIVHPVLTT